MIYILVLNLITIVALYFVGAKDLAAILLILEIILWVYILKAKKININNMDIVKKKPKLVHIISGVGLAFLLYACLSVDTQVMSEARLSGFVEFYLIVMCLSIALITVSKKITKKTAKEDQ